MNCEIRLETAPGTASGAKWHLGDAEIAKRGHQQQYEPLLAVLALVRLFARVDACMLRELVAGREALAAVLALVRLPGRAHGGALLVSGACRTGAGLREPLGGCRSHLNNNMQSKRHISAPH